MLGPILDLHTVVGVLCKDQLAPPPLVRHRVKVFIMFHILAAQEQHHQADTEQSLVGVKNENKRLVAQMDVMKKELEDLSAVNKSLNEEVRRLREELNRTSSSGRSMTPARTRQSRKAQSSNTKPIIKSLTDIMTPNDVLVAGLLYAGFEPARLQKNNNERKIKWFKSFYGVAPTTVVPYFQDIKDMYPSINYKDCLMTMNWMYLYDTQPVLSARWKNCEEYIGDKVVEYGLKMAKVGRKKIIFELSRKVKLGRTVDCVTFMVQEMRLDPSAKWFDYKTHSCGLVSNPEKIASIINCGQN